VLEQSGKQSSISRFDELSWSRDILIPFLQSSGIDLGLECPGLGLEVED